MSDSAETIHILIVDDEQDIRDGSERILTRMKFNVSTAASGQEALEFFQEITPDIVLLDLKMPGMDGMEVLDRIRKINDNTIVIVITGYATVETAIQAMKHGAYDFIPKPFEPDQLRLIVSRASEKIRLKMAAEELARERQRTLLDLGTEKSRIRTIIESLPNGVLVTNTLGRVVLVNPAFKQIMGVELDHPLEDNLDRYLSDDGLCKLVMEISQGRHIDFEDIPEYEFSISRNQHFMAKGRPVLGQKKECLGAVVTIVDITALKMIDLLKSEFVAKVSHELRSPLSTIHEQLAVVLGDMMDIAPETDQKILGRAKEKTHSLISLIGDLLDLSRIEEGIICKEPVPVQVDALLKSIIEFLQDKAKAKKQTLTLEILDENLPDIQADPLALESVFGNLITNAINYTPENGHIRITAEMAGINVRVNVIDNGFGIESRHLDQIFERFYRVKNDQTRYITGTGLGLPIVKELVQALGGFIEAESEFGKGSTFTVLLPVALNS
ncbi:MAG: response regulator [Desulfobacterales bacterium]|nr:response regulator [Desulfobacterales bacterium]MDX2512111.1 response regulator [Desulfobacterales bacterium]